MLLITWRAVLFGWACVLATTAEAQQFNQLVTFGDSSVDSGWYRNSPTGYGGPNPNSFDARIQTAITQGGQVAFTTPGGLMPSQVVGSYLGLASDPANQPGGTNYATGGARGYLSNVGIPGNPLFPGAVPITAQIQNYLSANGGRANPDALYVISGGGNDQNYAFNHLAAGAGSPQAGGATTRVQYFNNVADNLAASITGLRDAGAQYIIVPNVNYSPALGFGPFGSADSFNFTQRLWNGLAAHGVNFIPADRDAVLVHILANPALFGFTNVTRPTASSAFTGACPRPASGGASGGAWALICTPANVSPNAQNILYADNEHFTAAGQRILGDYYYSLLVAPSQISFLAENAIKAGTRFTETVQGQMDVSMSQRGRLGVNAWVVGDVSHLGMNNYPGFPDDPSTPASLTAGLDYRVAPGIIVGGVARAGTLKSTFSWGGGDFRQRESGVGLYAGLTAGGWWGTLVGAYGHFNYDVHRNVTLAIATLANTGETSGNDWSAATQVGYKFSHGEITHGPVVGLAWQYATVGAFKETGGITSLAFGGQTRDSLISTLGYKVTLDLGMLKPFAHVAWHRELADTERMVSAALTTVTAPTYTMPGVVLGKDWGSAALGTMVKINDSITASAAATAEIAQKDVHAYGGRVALTVTY